MKKHIYIYLGIILTFGTHSCKKQGCTDIGANNYNYLAKKDDGSCTYANNGKLGPKKLPCYVPSSSVNLVNDPNREVDYLIDCKLQINSYSSLIIQEGVVIEFTENGSIDIMGSFTAIGSSSNPIIFRGVNSNNDNWQGLIFRATSVSMLKNVIIQDASNITYSSTTSLYSPSIFIDFSSSITIDSCIISGSSGYGIVCPSKDSTKIISNTEIYNCNIPLLKGAGSLDRISNLNIHDNTGNYIDLTGGYVGSSLTIPNIGVEYRVTHAYGSTSLGSNLYLSSSSSLQIDPGVIIKFGINSGIKLTGGSFTAVGSSTNMIRLLGVGTTPGSWIGIQAWVNSQNINMDYVEVANAGQNNSNTPGSIYLTGNTGTASITNSIIRDAGTSCGINLNQNTINVTTTGTTFSNVTQNICP